MKNVIFIHGLESSGQGFKGQLFKKTIPGCLTPDFEPFNPSISYRDLLTKRMLQLESILNKKNKWIIIGSSFGGLMAALYCCNFPEKVSRLILLAPLLAVPELDPKDFEKIKVPVIIFHGRNDSIVSLKAQKARAEKIFKNLTYNIVEDDHMLHSTVVKLKWRKLIK